MVIEVLLSGGVVELGAVVEMNKTMLADETAWLDETSTADVLLVVVTFSKPLNLASL